MKTSGSRKWSVSRIRSPSSAPCVNGLDGSTEITPTVCSSARTRRISAEARRRLADAGRPGQPDGEGVAGLRIDVADHLVGERVAVLDEGDRTRERAAVARQHGLDEALARPVAPLAHARMLRSQPAGDRRLGSDAVREHVARCRPPAAVRQAGERRTSSAPRRRSSARRRRPSRAPSSALCALMITVNARPRKRSTVCSLDDQHGHRERETVAEAGEHHRERRDPDVRRRRGAGIPSAHGTNAERVDERTGCAGRRARSSGGSRRRARRPIAVQSRP